MKLRTPAEVIARIAALDARPIGLGFHNEVLVLHGLDFETAKPFLVVDADPDDGWPDPTIELVADQAVDYLGFAIDKALNHRGLSALRSIEKLECFCWLLGADPGLVSDPPFPYYGVPGLKAAAGFLDADWPSDPRLANMARGQRCHDECVDGCGL